MELIKHRFIFFSLIYNAPITKQTPAMMIGIPKPFKKKVYHMKRSSGFWLQLPFACVKPLQQEKLHCRQVPQFQTQYDKEVDMEV